MRKGLRDENKVTDLFFENSPNKVTRCTVFLSSGKRQTSSCPDENKVKQRGDTPVPT